MKRVWSVIIGAVLMVLPKVKAQHLEGINIEHIYIRAINTMQPVVNTMELPGNITLEYAEQGNSQGMPVILLHGFTDSWKSFETVMSHLPHQLHVFAISLRGHGNSAKHPRQYHPEDFAKDIAAFIQKKKLGPVIIAGHSMGSTIAQCFAAAHPALTRGLVLASSFAHYQKQEVDEFKKAIDALEDPIDSAFVDGFQRSTIVNNIAAEMLNSFISESRKLPAHVWKGVAAGWKTSNYLDALKTFDKPTLIVWGDKDAYCPRADQDSLLKTIKNSRLLEYKGVGHALHWEMPEKFAADLAAFASSIE